MKKNIIYTILLFLLNSIFSYAQTSKDPYIPILGGNRVWYTAARAEFGDVEATVFNTNGTEIINGIEYTKIDGNGATWGYIREDIENRKIYKRWGTNEQVLYDFSLEVGDSFYMEVAAHIWYDVIAIEYIETNVGLRKAWFLSGQNGDLLPVWIEGIGSMAGILTPQYQPNLNWWNFPELLCFKNEEIMEYKSNNGMILGCELENIGIVEQEVDKQIKIFPNPTSGILSINSSILNSTIKVVITDMYGRTHLNKNTDSTKNIDITFLNQGIYILTIIDQKQKRRFTKKIIKL